MQQLNRKQRKTENPFTETYFDRARKLSGSNQDECQKRGPGCSVVKTFVYRSNVVLGSDCRLRIDVVSYICCERMKRIWEDDASLRFEVSR